MATVERCNATVREAVSSSEAINLESSSESCDKTWLMFCAVCPCGQEAKLTVDGELQSRHSRTASDGLNRAMSTSDILR